MEERPWDGRERRKNPTDHDTLITLVQIMKNHVDNFNDHRKDDGTAFGEINKKLDKHAYYIAMGIGILAALKVLLH